MNKKNHRATFWKLSLWMYLFATGTSFALPANTVTVLTFEGVGDYNPVGNYYNGGSAEDYGIYFSNNTLALVSIYYGGHGNFANSASMPTLLFFTDGSESIMDVVGGFDTGFSFYYTSSTSNAFYSVYSGLDGSGTLLANGSLANTYYSDGGFDTSGNQVGVTFSGRALSVFFGGAANQVGFDNITLGSSHAVFGAALPPASTDIDLAKPQYLASNLGASVNPVFAGGTLLVDLPGTYADNFTVDASGTSTIDQGGLASTFSGAFSDATSVVGHLNIANSGTNGAVTFTGTNTYTGGTTINSGATLALGDGGTTGSVVGDVTDNGALVFNRSDAVTFGGIVSGAGTLTQAGTGTLTLTGTNTYTGGTTINSGATLALGNGDTTGSIVGNVADNGALAFNRSDAVTFGGIVSGAGTLTQAGTGTLTLTGTNTYAGGTAINNGAIAIGADANLGAANGLLAISGGSLQLTSNVSTARPIGIGSSGGIINTGASQLSTTGILIGPGNLTLQGGTGSWNLGGNASAYTGSFRVAQGTLYLNTALGASQLTVSPGATLRGTGLLAGALSVQGQLNPGNSQGTLSVVGPVSFAAGSTATFEIDGTGTGSGAGNYSRLVSSSSIILNGGMVVPVLRGLSGSASNTFVPSLAQRFNVMAGAGGITGAFAGLTQPTAGLPTGLTFDLVYGTSSVDLILTPADYGQITAVGIGYTPNRARTGTALQTLRPAAGARPASDVATVYPALFSLDTAGLTTALDQIGTNVYGQLLEGALTDRSELMATVARYQPHRDPVWFDTTAGRDFAPGDGLSRGYGQTNLGAMVGFDLWRTAPWLAGVAIQKQAGRLSSNGADRAYAKLDEMGGLAYARYTQGPWQFNLDGETSRTAAEVSRTIAFGGLALRALGQPVVNTASLSATLSRDYQRAGFLIQPSVGLTYGTAWAHAFTDTGADPLSLHVHSVSDERAATLLAIDLSRRLLGARHPLLLSVNLGYEHQLNTTGAESRVNLTASGSPIFTLRSQRPAADLLRLRGLAAFTLGENAEAYLSAQNTALSQKQTGYSLRGGLNLHF